MNQTTKAQVSQKKERSLSPLEIFFEQSNTNQKSVNFLSVIAKNEI
jgi:hypothetical protein